MRGLDSLESDMHRPAIPSTLPSPVDIRDYLMSFRGDEIIYRPNRGNAGDCLIAATTFELFKQLNIRYRLASRGEDLTGKIVIYGGGGGLGPEYTGPRDFIASNHRHVRRLVVLPHSIYGNEDLVRSLGSNVDFICRDPVSFAHVQRVGTRANVMLGHDLAFSLDARDFLKTHSCGLRFFRYSAKELRWSLRLRSRARRILQSSQRWREAARESTQLNCVRQDRERSSLSMPEQNADISAILSTKLFSENSCRESAYRLLQVINSFEKVRTNRLHVCIAAALLRKSVIFSRNSYFKNSAIYEFSIRDNFPNVSWEKIRYD